MRPLALSALRAPLKLPKTSLIFKTVAKVATRTLPILQYLQQILPITAFDLRVGESLQLLITNKPLPVSRFLRAGNLQTLALLNGLHILRGAEKVLMGPGIQPGITTAHNLHI